jgi:RimJ/RimL family protein N-acetyltransferase
LWKNAIKRANFYHGSIAAINEMRLKCNQYIVRDWRQSDRDALLEIANNRNVWRNLGERFPHPYTASDADQWFSHLEAMAEPTHWAIEVDGRAVGGVGVDLGTLEFSKSGRFGYWLGESYWGRGIMTEVVQVTADYVLQEYGLVRLEAPVFEWNPASMRVLEKCGFEREGVLRRSIFKAGEIIDAVLYAKVV